MTTSTFKFDLGTLGTQMATRPNGQAFLEEAMAALKTHESVVLDFAHRSPTPSFADQCIGGLVRTYGLAGFKQKVRIVNLSDDAKPLVRHIILSRASEARPAMA